MYSPSIISEALDEDLFSKDSEIPDAPEAVEGQVNDSDLLDEDQVKGESEERALKQEESIGRKDAQEGTAESPPKLPFAESDEHRVVIESGDTLGSVLNHLGFNKTDVHLASSALNKIFNLKNLKIGQEIVVRGKKGDDAQLTLMGLEIRPDYRFKVIVQRKGDNFISEKVEVPVKSVVRNISGSMDPRSPNYSMSQCGLNGRIANEALRILGQVVNLRQSKSQVDFEFLCKYFYDNDGNSVSNPELLYVSVLFNGRIIRLYKFKDKDNTCEYVDSNGTIINTVATNGSMLAHPLSTMKITSGFGLRIHPISRKLKGHTGIDLSASVGTPVRAAANGIVYRASPYHGYGNYINIKHTPGISTAYAHLSRISVRSGQHVQQGQIIGYVGNTGRSTGNHLHYEVLSNGHPINPLSFIKREPNKLSGLKLFRFNRFKKDVNLQIVGLTQLSKKGSGKSKKYS
jgi:murein DD-endopeptidase MepM/ murein hydrolase activator NlpD